MKLYIKQKVFAIKDRFTVWGEDGSDRYYVEGELFTFGKKLHIYDANNREAALIQQKLFRFLPCYVVSVNGVDIAEIVKEFTFFKPKYTIKGLNWSVEGDLFAHDYTVFENGNPVVRIRKEWMTWGDSYELTIADPSKELAALAVVITIDCVMAQTAASSSAAT